MKEVNPGSLNKIISIYNGANAVLTNIHASVNNVSGTQIVVNGGELNSVKTRFLIRYTPTVIDNDMTIEFNGHKYAITYVNEYGYSHQYIEIIASVIDWS